MDVLRIEGGQPLYGEVEVSGAKNACLPLFAACLLTDQECVLENVPDLADVRFMAELLRHLGAKVEKLDAHTWRIEAKHIETRAPYDLVRKMRASVCLMGPLLGRCRQAEISLPGGCVIGPRPIDLHLKGFSRMGCEITTEKGYVHLNGKAMRGSQVFLGGRHGSTVLGTANILMAAVLTPGVTRIESSACEPEVVDLCHFLQAMGADIEGVGSHELVVTGVQKLKGARHAVIPDRIEAGTLLIAAAMTKGNLLVKGLRPGHLTALLDKLEEVGVSFSQESPSAIRVQGGDTYQPVDIVTLPHPGFPTDLQAQMCALMAITPGLSIVTEKIYPNRFMHVPELQRMGADIAIEGHSAIIKGTPNLSGAPVMASDLRASAALVLAGLAARGETWVQRIYHLDRGYEKLEQKLSQVGAQIERLDESALPAEFSED
ncbi:MAG: UDP-N-acetylglucosamine 1-carboxyvinyltransferase [Opitutales bacterium]|nr:UDP-N-acetylglucosamine 1-carboxyvinyltransferase [Opitutales bacterium]MCH8539926.1 UDP-N-acetylglucosamine 1-carboxyvinyltransferase [Opitutales bacterium]